MKPPYKDPALRVYYLGLAFGWAIGLVTGSVLGACIVVLAS